MSSRNIGAEVLRLWVAAQDYRDDIRISQEILTRLAEAYRRIRNTCRYILGNIARLRSGNRQRCRLPKCRRSTAGRMHQLELLKEKVLTAYDDCEFHVLYHAVNGFCTRGDERLLPRHPEGPGLHQQKDSLERRSAQTAMYQILDALVTGGAGALLHRRRGLALHAGLTRGERPPGPLPGTQTGAEGRCPGGALGAIMKVRSEVSKALELARVQKIIGHSLDAAVAIEAPPEIHSLLHPYATELKSILIVSKAELVGVVEADCFVAEGIAGLKIKVTAAPGEKCERCWCYDEELGQDSEHPGICPKCLAAVK